jgi:hypothetical protein
MSLANSLIPEPEGDHNLTRPNLNLQIQGRIYGIKNYLRGVQKGDINIVTNKV